MEYAKYNKTMVLLSEENREFAAKEEQAIYGNLRMETGNNKGAISLSVQNLRFFERNKYIYKLILFGEKKERTIHTVIGSLILNRFGTGENYFRFDPTNVDGKGGKISDYSVAIVAAVSMRDNKEPLHPVLKGKLSAAGSVAAARTEKSEETDSESGADMREGAARDPRANRRKPMDRNLREGRGEFSDRDEFAGDIETVGTRGEWGRNEGEKSSREDLIPSKEKIKSEKVSYNKFYNEYLREICEKTAKAAELYDTVAPFSRDKTEAKWKRIANIKNLPIVSPGALWGASKYRHYIFGEDARMYYLGIPGRFLNEEQPEGGRSGFVLWQPIIGAEVLEATKAECSLENRMTAYGYWITAIEKATGDIVDPVIL